MNEQDNIISSGITNEELNMAMCQHLDHDIDDKGIFTCKTCGAKFSVIDPKNADVERKCSDVINILESMKIMSHHGAFEYGYHDIDGPEHHKFMKSLNNASDLEYNYKRWSLAIKEYSVMIPLLQKLPTMLKALNKLYYEYNTELNKSDHEGEEE